MNKHWKHIIHQCLAIALLCSLLTPAVFNLFHSFDHHEHITHCDNNVDTHLHELEVDCHFYTQYITPHFFYFSVDLTEEYDQKEIKTSLITAKEHWFSNLYLSYCSLRGPPAKIG